MTTGDSTTAIQPAFDHGSQYRFARLAGPSLHALAPLFGRVYGRRDFTPQWLEEKYGFEYNGIGAFACVAFTNDDQPAAAVGVLPWPIRYGEHIEVAGQLVDGATSAVHRQRGLFVHVAEMAARLSAAAGMSFMFGFAKSGGGSYRCLTRDLHYRHIDDLIQHQALVRTLPIERVTLRVPSLHRFYRRHVYRTLKAYTPGDSVFDNSLLRDGFAATERTQAFLEYKSFAGSRVLETGCGRAWVNVRRGILIGDVEGASDVDMRDAIRMLRRLGARLGVDRVLCQAPADTRFSRLATLGFATSPALAVLYQNLNSTINADRLRFTLGDLDNF